MLHDTDINGLVGWIDNYCRAHPAYFIMNAAMAFAIRAAGRHN
jgi:hypothetical protein